MFSAPYIKRLAGIAVLLLLASCKKEYITYQYNVYDREEYSIILNGQPLIQQGAQPPYLQAGDSVAICATSNALTWDEMQNGIALLQSWGLKVRQADNLYDKDGRYAGTVSQRRENFVQLANNPYMKAIIAARGGYGCDQLIPMDLQGLVQNPKWLVGYSDLTVLHAAINNMAVQTIHGPMANNLANETSAANLKKALFGQYAELSIATNENCIQGSAEGRLVGGNLTTFYSLGGTIIDLNVKGCILFFEEVGEANYNIDRMLNNLRLSGKLDAVKGIVVGYMSDTKQGNDKPINEIILDNVGHLGIPVLYGVPCGHESPNYPLYLGRKVKLEVGPTTGTITF